MIKIPLLNRDNREAEKLAQLNAEAYQKRMREIAFDWTIENNCVIEARMEYTQYGIRAVLFFREITDEEKNELIRIRNSQKVENIALQKNAEASQG